MLWLKCQKQITGETAEVNKELIAGCSGAGHAFRDGGMPFLLFLGDSIWRMRIS